MSASDRLKRLLPTSAMKEMVLLITSTRSTRVVCGYLLVSLQNLAHGVLGFGVEEMSNPRSSNFKLEDSPKMFCALLAAPKALHSPERAVRKMVEWTESSRAQDGC